MTWPGRPIGCVCKYTIHGERAEVLGCPVHAACMCRYVTRLEDCPLHGACGAGVTAEGREIERLLHELRAVRLQRDTLGRELDRAHDKIAAARRELAIERRAHEHTAAELDAREREARDAHVSAYLITRRGLTAQQWAIACRVLAESEGGS